MVRIGKKSLVETGRAFVFIRNASNICSKSAKRPGSNRNTSDLGFCVYSVASYEECELIPH